MIGFGRGGEGRERELGRGGGKLGGRVGEGRVGWAGVG